MSWRDSDQAFLKSSAWRFPWWAAALVIAPLALTLLLVWLFPSQVWIFAAFLATGVGFIPTTLILRKWAKRKEIVETGCLWCLYPTVDPEGRCPECGKFTTPANRDVARHVLKHRAAP